MARLAAILNQEPPLEHNVFGYRENTLLEHTPSLMHPFSVGRVAHARMGVDSFCPHSIRRVETQSFRDVPRGSMACLFHQACSSPKR